MPITRPRRVHRQARQPQAITSQRAEGSAADALTRAAGGHGTHRNFERHVDMGPRFTDGKFQLMIHDDHAATPIWRSVDDVLYRGSDAALRQVPDDDRYSFVGAQPGEQVYVIPQTETKGVVWPGWTTQDPGLVQKTSRGVTLTLEQVQGPGGSSRCTWRMGTSRSHRFCGIRPSTSRRIYGLRRTRIPTPIGCLPSPAPIC